MSCVLCLCQVAQQVRVCDIGYHVVWQVAGIARVSGALRRSALRSCLDAIHRFLDLLHHLALGRTSDHTIHYWSPIYWHKLSFINLFTYTCMGAVTLLAMSGLHASTRLTLMLHASTRLTRAAPLTCQVSALHAST